MHEVQGDRYFKLTDILNYTQELAVIDISSKLWTVSVRLNPPILATGLISKFELSPLQADAQVYRFFLPVCPPLRRNGEQGLARSSR